MARRQIWIVWFLFAVLAQGSLAREELAAGDEFSDPMRSGGVGPLMVVIPGGRFVMGGWPVGQGEMGVIRIDYRLVVSATEVTIGQYRQFLTATRSASLGKFPPGNDQLPATNISFDEAEAYTTWLSRETGHTYRLPSASEWEYAARAGSSSIYSWGDEVGENKANCLDCRSPYAGRLAPVGSFPANPWGLYDMHGNVWEWTKDCIDANSAPPGNGMPQLFGNCDQRELRGGSGQSDAWSIRASARAFGFRNMSNNDVGFRLAMDLSQ